MQIRLYYNPIVIERLSSFQCYRRTVSDQIEGELYIAISQNI